MAINNKGFTLVELIVVIAVIGIISTIGVASYTNYLKIARDSVRIVEARKVYKALQAYKNLYGTNPIDTGNTRNGIGTSCCATCNTWNVDEFNKEFQILINSGLIDKAPSADLVNFCWFDYGGSTGLVMRVSLESATTEFLTTSPNTCRPFSGSNWCRSDLIANDYCTCFKE